MKRTAEIFGGVLLVCALAATSVAESKPEHVVVHEFSYRSGQISMDSLFGDAEEETEGGELSPQEAQKLLGGETASALVKELVARMEAFGFAASAGKGPDSGTLLEVRGQFMNTDEKNKTVVGLGTGDGDVQVEVQLYQATADGRAKLEEFKTATPRKAKPDLASDDWREEARAEAARTAKDLATELGRFFVAKGWITQQKYDEALR